MRELAPAVRWFPLGLLLFVATLLLVPASAHAVDQSNMRVAVSVSRGCSIDIAGEAGAADARVVVECGRRGVEPVVTTEDVDAAEWVEFEEASDVQSADVPADDADGEPRGTYTVVTIQF